jgi:hypothetical protein
MPNPGLRLKEPAIAGYAYNPSKPPFEKGGFVVSPWLTSPRVSRLCIRLGALSKSMFFVSAYIHYGEEVDYNSVRWFYFLCYILYIGENFVNFVCQ